jgi:subtilisin family serine protease
MEEQSSTIDRLIVQGRPFSEAVVAVPSLGIRLAGLASTLGFSYLGDINQHLVRHRVDLGGQLGGLPTHHLLEVPQSDVPQVINAITRQFADVESVEHDLRLTLSAPFNFDTSAQSTNRSSLLPQAYARSGRRTGPNGSGVRIAVVDSGAEAGTPIAGFYDLADLVNADQQPPAHLDSTGHGTSMISIIKDIAPGAEIYAIRVCGNSNTIGLWDLIAGISTALVVYADIVNLSLGCAYLDFECPVCGGTGKGRSIALQRFIEAIHHRVVPGRPGARPVFVAATGNSAQANQPLPGFEWPAYYESVLAVGSINSSGDRSSFSNYGTTKANMRYVLCPGGETVGTAEDIGHFAYTDQTGTTQYSAIHGTSPATAYASGVLACYDEYAAGQQGPLTGDQLLTLALSNCQRLSNHQDLDHGLGRLVFDPVTGTAAASGSIPGQGSGGVT